ncbi:MAG: hypothetical protein ACTS6J_10355 [Burkholderiales bacterium]
MQRQNEGLLRRFVALRHLFVVAALLLTLLPACSKMETVSSPPGAEPAMTVIGHAPPAKARADGVAEEKANKEEAIKPASGGAGTAAQEGSPASTGSPDAVGYEVDSEKKSKAMPPRPKPVPASPPVAAKNGGSSKAKKAAAPARGFPWPPPQPSSLRVLQTSLLAAASGKTLGDLDRVLTDALDQIGYTDRSYFTIPGGYVLVTRLEGIEPDGTPKAGEERWSSGPPAADSFTLSNYFAALFSAKPGLYRVIVFAITPQPFQATGKPPTAAQTQDWLSRGYNVLPPQVATLRYTDEVACTALIYEFEKAPAGTAQIKQPGRIPAQQHLERNRLVSVLGG